MSGRKVSRLRAKPKLSPGSIEDLQSTNSLDFFSCTSSQVEVGELKSLLLSCESKLLGPSPGESETSPGSGEDSQRNNSYPPFGMSFSFCEKDRAMEQ